MPSEAVEPTIAEWKRLFAATQTFREAAPWDLLDNFDLFAVEVPGHPEPGYCCVMGASGIEYGLIAGRGAAGLLGFTLMLNDALDQDELLLVQDCVSLSLADREYLDDRDRAVHRGAGVRFRGRGAWPLFRSVRPNLTPTHVNASEADFLATCLEQSLEVARGVGSGAIAIVPGPGLMVVRRQTGDGLWESAAATIVNPVLKVSFERSPVEQLRRMCARSAERWELRMIAFSQFPGKGAEPGYWGRVLLCVESTSGIILPSRLLARDTSAHEALLQIAAESATIPAELRVTSRLLEEQLRPVATALGASVVHVKKLPRLERASRSLMSRFH